VAAALERSAALTLRFVDEPEGRRLNHEFRGKNYPTNVLTFVYSAPGAASLQGDIVICVPVAAREAAAQGIAPLAHLAHLVVHGVLHLQGYDHERDDDAAKMEMRESQILGNLGFPDPYAG
jgi:probable rRNA maturation factor